MVQKVKTIQGVESREVIKKTVNEVCGIVTSTLGAKGKLVVLTHPTTNHPKPTKDGVSVVTSLNPVDDFERQICSIIKESSVATVNEAGDSTTTTLSLLQGLYNTCLEYDIEEVRAEMLEAIEKVKELSSQVRDTKDIYNIAHIASNNDEKMASAIKEAYDRVGLDGYVKAGSKEVDNYMVTVKKGIKTKGTLFSQHFATHRNPKPCVKFMEEDEGVNLLLLNISHITDTYKLRKLLDLNSKTVSMMNPRTGTKQNIKVWDKHLVVLVNNDTSNKIAEYFATENLNMIKELQGNPSLMKAITIIKIDNEKGQTDETFHDISKYLNMDYISDENLSILENNSISNRYITTVKTVECIDNELVIDTNKGENIYVDKLRKMKDESEDKAQKKKLQSRINMLISDSATIECGKDTVSNLSETRDRLDDSLNAVRTAIKHGYIAGAGKTLSYISNGFKYIDKALNSPYETILQNAEIKAMPPTEEYPKALNVKTNKVVNLIDTGLVDSAKSITCAMKNALSTYEVLANIDTITVKVDD